MSKQKYPLACLIMASGAARRFGSNKLLAKFNGQPLLAYILRLTASLTAQRLVITRSAAAQNLCRQLAVPCICHHQPYQSDTVRIGVEHITANVCSKNIKGLLFCVADQPLLTEGSLRILCEAFLQDSTKICRLAYGNTVGNPIIFPMDLAEKLKHLPQDKGGGYLAKKYPERVRLVQVQDEYELYDIDTQNDLEQLEAAKNSDNESP